MSKVYRIHSFCHLFVTFLHYPHDLLVDSALEAEACDHARMCIPDSP